MKNIVSITVVIPCFNCSETISRAVNSVLAQTVLPEQIVLIDDRSTDQTIKVLSALSVAHPSVKVLQNATNGGASVARNYGWNEAKTKYVAFLDADDYWHPAKIEVQFNWMEQNPNVAFSGHLITVAGPGEPPGAAKTGQNAELILPRNMLFRNYFATSSIMLKTALPIRFNPEKRRSEDYLLWLTLLLSGFTAALIREPLGSRFAAPFGEAGLSGSLFRMQAAELDTFKYVRSKKYVSGFDFSLAVVFSCIKFVRRLAISTLRNVARRTYA